MPSRPILRLKTSRPTEAPDCPKCDGWLIYLINTDEMGCAKCDYREAPREYPIDPALKEELRRELLGPQYPAFWIKGQLLRVTRSGDNFMLTVLEEDFDHRAPERALVFDNSYDCNQFLGNWYNREITDPRAG